MPYKSAKQRRFFKGCKHNRKRMGKKCPPKRVIQKYDRHGGRKR